MNSLTRFGSYGFLAALLSAQFAMFPGRACGDTDREALDAKKAGRAMKRDFKKGTRKATGQDNVWEDTKDETSDAAKNARDEVRYHAKKKPNR